MANERLSLEELGIPGLSELVIPHTSWKRDYEHSTWLNVEDPTIHVEGDPKTKAEFAAASDFLNVVTVYFKTDYGSTTVPGRNGLWWTVTAEDVKAELEHRNQWATWEALLQRGGDESLTALINLEHVLALSFRRLQTLQSVGGPNRPEYPLFLHLHEQIRKARLAEAELQQVLRPGQEPPPLSPFLRTPVWKLLDEIQERYDPDTHTNTIIYGDNEHARYGFEVIDPYQPRLPETEYEREMHFFPNSEQAIAVHYEYQYMGYMIGTVDDYAENIILVEPWEDAMY